VLLATWLLGAAGCAQVTFPELPQGLFARPMSDAEARGTGEAQAAQPTDAAPADSTDPAAEPAQDDVPAPQPGKLYEWIGDGRTLTRIVIDTNDQTAHFYAGQERVGWSTIASGVSSHPTPRGEFAILEKVRDKRSNLYGKIVARNGKVIRASAHGRDPVPRGAVFVGASMPNFMRLTYDGIGMHAGPIPKPGRPASHGCIRMPPELAAAVFEHVSTGTAVTVVGDGPDYGNYAERIARQQAEERARRAAAAAAAEGTALDALDAEIEALNEAGIGTGDTAATGSTPAAPGEPPPADARGSASADAPPPPGPAGEEAPSTTGRNAADAKVDRPSAPADSGTTGAARSEPERAETRDETPSASPSGASNDSRAPDAADRDTDARADAGSTTRTRRPEPDTPDTPSTPAPHAAPGDVAPAPHHAPPPPTIRSAEAITTPDSQVCAAA
jgi:lipoprotein-anchoring transpeptidase ErfK/SrfK